MTMWRNIILAVLLLDILLGTSAQNGFPSFFDNGLNNFWRMMTDSMRPSTNTNVRSQTFRVVFGPDGPEVVSMNGDPVQTTENVPFLPSNPTPTAPVNTADKRVSVPEITVPTGPTGPTFPESSVGFNSPPETPATTPKTTCTAEYSDLPGHTMCMYDDPRVIRSGVTPAMKKMITDLHNEYRSKVEPPAADLTTVRWDERIAAVAQKWANQCQAGHDRERKIPSIPGMTIGQNVAGGYRTWERAVFLWYDEIKLWHYGVDPESYLGADGWRKIGHFTQMVQNGTYLIGCGYAECRQSVYTRYYVCNYAAGQSNLAVPYTLGAPALGRRTRCSACPNSCNNGLCDCKGRVCLNGGKLNPNTCTCSCTKLYEGASCQKLKCPTKDKFICGRQWRKSLCDKFYNVPWECPYMCGICKHPEGAENHKETTFVSQHGCRFQGRRASPAECRKHGERGLDILSCASKGGHISCGDCDRYHNVLSDMCPVMCGLCDPQCNGKKCENKGVLDTDTCTCRCKKPYIGATCTQVDCKVQDASYCKRWPISYCKTYSNVPVDCRHRCKLCR